MSKYFRKLDALRGSILDAESVLHFMCNRENLKTLLDHGSPEDPIRAMLEGAYSSVSDANEICEELQKTENEDFGVEIAETANKILEAGCAGKQSDKESAPTASAPVDTIAEDLEKIASASAVISELMQRILVERTYQGCPDWMESNYTLGGLVQASEIMADCLFDLNERMAQGAQS